ncbi:integrase, catalytic region, zinc finger, CCHC-type containing protein [Tanacetum coccineum]
MSAVRDLHTTNFDQLHAYLEQHELHANEVRLLRERNQDPLAFVANQQMTPPHFNTYQSSYNNPQLQQQFSPSQYGSIHPNQHYSSTYPSQPQFNHSSVQPAYPYQSQMNHQTSSVPQIAYQSPQVTTQPMTESPLMELSFCCTVAINTAKRRNKYNMWTTAAMYTKKNSFNKVIAATMFVTISYKIQEQTPQAQPRKVNKKNLVVEPIRDVDVKHSLLNANSKLICATCKKSMFDGVHDMCLLDFVENVVQIVLWYLDSGCSKHMTGNRSQLMNFDPVTQNLYTISLDDMLKTSLICLLSKASKTKSWLWNRRLLHLNFGTLNKLAKDGLARGIPRLKFQKDHLCSACTLGKSKKSSHQPKAKDTNQEKLYLLHMDLCCPMCMASINGKKLMQDKKPDLSFFHVFGSLYYPTNDNYDLGKLDAKADIGIFVGYALAKKAFRIYNKRTRKIIETIHVTFDELTVMASEQFSLGPGLYSMTPATSSSGLVSHHVSQQPCIPPKIDDWDRLFQPMFDEYFNYPSIAISLVQEAAAPRAVVLADSPVSTSIDQDAPSTSNPSTQEQEHSPNISQGFEESIGAELNE